MKALLLLFFFLTSDLASASDPSPGWTDWRLDISPNRCILIRNYYIPSQHLVDPSRRGFLSHSPYTRAHVRIGVTTVRPYPQFSASEVGKVRFVVQIVPGSEISVDDRVIQVDIGGFSIDKRYTVSNRPDSDDYWLSAEQTQLLMSRLEKNDAIGLTFYLASGQQISSTLYPPGNKNFNVWRKVFETCATVNVR